MVMCPLWFGQNVWQKGINISNKKCSFKIINFSFKDRSKTTQIKKTKFFSSWEELAVCITNVHFNKAVKSFSLKKKIGSFDFCCLQISKKKNFFKNVLGLMYLNEIFLHNELFIWALREGTLKAFTPLSRRLYRVCSIMLQQTAPLLQPPGISYQLLPQATQIY